MVKGKGKVDLVLNQTLHHEDVWGTGGLVPRILNFGCRCWPLDGRLCGPQSCSGHCGEQKNLLPYQESNLNSLV
jgi:hypothetical protein